MLKERFDKTKNDLLELEHLIQELNDLTFKSQDLREEYKNYCQAVGDLRTNIFKLEMKIKEDVSETIQNLIQKNIYLIKSE